MKRTCTTVSILLLSVLIFTATGCFPDRHVTEPEYAPDFTRPSVSHVVPISNARNVPINIELSIWFSKLMQTESIPQNMILSIFVEMDSIRTLAFDPQNTGVAYAGKKGGGIFKSSDGGIRWEWISLENPELSVIDLEIGRTSSNLIYALTESMLYKSIDAGITWSAMESIQDIGALTSMTVSATNENILYVATNGNGVFKSTTGGDDWVAKNQGLRLGRRFNDVTISEHNDDILFIASEGDYIYRSIDGGESWVRVRDGLTSRDITIVHISSSDPGLVLAGSLDNGLFMSTNSGNDWTTVSDEVEYKMVYDVATHPENSDKIVMATDGGVYRSSTNGDAWEAIEIRSADNSILDGEPSYTVVFDPHLTETVFVGNDFGLFRGELTSGIVAYSADVDQDNLIVDGNYRFEKWKDTTMVVALRDYSDETSADNMVIHPYVNQRALGGWIAAGKVGPPPVDPNPDATRAILTPQIELLEGFRYKLVISGSFLGDDTYKGDPGVEDIHGNSMEYDFIRLFSTRK
jgi:photosystem II stability/assembly factor-like uncharacterized protein